MSKPEVSMTQCPSAAVMDKFRPEILKGRIKNQIRNFREKNTKPQLITLLSSIPLPPSLNLTPKPINDIFKQKPMRKLRVKFIERPRIIPA